MIDPNLFGTTEKAQGDAGTQAHGHEGPRAHGDTGIRERDTAGTEAQGTAAPKHRRIVVYLPPDVAEALDAAYVAKLAQRPTGPDRATRSQVAAELLRQALGLAE